MTAWHEEPINKKHDREGFDCGEEALNEFLRRYARKSHELGGAKTFLAIDDAGNKAILGFYSLSPASIVYARTPETVRRGLARHDVPGFRLARLAVDRRFQGKGIGGQLLLAAGKRCLLAAAEVGGVVLVIDAKNESVAEWYAGYGAVPLVDAPLSLLLPLVTIEAALKKGENIELVWPARSDFFCNGGLLRFPVLVVAGYRGSAGSFLESSQNSESSPLTQGIGFIVDSPH